MDKIETAAASVHEMELQADMDRARTDLLGPDTQLFGLPIEEVLRYSCGAILGLILLLLILIWRQANRKGELIRGYKQVAAGNS